MLESPTIAANARNGTMASYGNDNNTFAEFDRVPMLNDFKTAELGYPYYDDVEVVRVMTPGNNKSTFIDRISNEWIRRFPKEYDAYQSKNEVVHDGLALTEWPVINKAQALNLKSMKIFTVEQLAAVSDINLESLGLGARDLREKAKAYLSRAVDASEITKLFSEMAKLKADNEALREMLSQPAQPLAAPVIDEKEAMLRTLKMKKG